jgi:uncharacterized Fe-S cluster protein YjdI
MQEYSKAGLTVRFDPKICTHSGNCVRGLPQVFDVKARPWVNMDGAEREAIIEQVRRCPSGALSFETGDAKE